MTSHIASRELRNNTRQVLDRVAEGEEIVITLRGNPVAVIAAPDTRRRWLPRAAFVALVEPAQADSGMRDDLRELLGDESTDDLRL